MVFFRPWPPSGLPGATHAEKPEQALHRTLETCEGPGYFENGKSVHAQGLGVVMKDVPFGKDPARASGGLHEQHVLRGDPFNQYVAYNPENVVQTTSHRVRGLHAENVVLPGTAVRAEDRAV